MLTEKKFLKRNLRIERRSKMSNKRNLISFLLALTSGLASVSMAAELTWTQKANMPTPRWALATAMVDGKIYAIGGMTSEPGSEVISTVEVYDPATNTWARKADMPTPRSSLSASVVNGKIYAIGGSPLPYTGLSTVEMYDPETDTWTKKPDMPTPRWALATAVVDGKIYVTGGLAGYSAPLVSAVDEYNPMTDAWIRKANMPTPRWALAAAVVDGKIYTIGGGTTLDGGRIVEAYDPKTDTWTRKANMSRARRQHSTSVVYGKIYAIGGWVNSGNTPYSIVEVYDPEMDTWVNETDMLSGRSCFSTSEVDGRIYAIGGTNRTHPCPATSTVYECDTGFSPPSPDFNGDGIVDSADMCIMVDHWHTDYPLCDIAPAPFGDGIVDVQDLILLSEHLFEDYRIVAHWALDETEGDIAYDSAGDNPGILNGNPIWQPDGGKVVGALQLDGIYDYLSTPFVLNPGNGSLCAFAWIKGGSSDQVIISQRGDFGGTWLSIDPLGKLKTEFSGIYFGDLISETVVTDGQWHHVGFVYDTDTFHRKLYVDGAQIAEDAAVVSGMPSDGGLYIGASKNLDAGTFFSGMIDDVRIYDVALNKEEIAALAQ
jgi:N-acetylneuraminic acid mutarotase